MKTITIGVFSDIICPWCYIGKKRLERAIMQVGMQDQVVLKMFAHQLYPQIPIGGINKNDMRSNKKAGLGTKLREEAAKESIVIDYRQIQVIPNTMQAHRLVAVSGNQQIDIMNNLFKAYFEFGKDVESLDSLVEIATTTNLSDDIIDQFQSDPNFGLEIVENQLKKAKSHGISAVPSFLLEDSFVIAGVQEVGRWTQYLERQARAL